MLLAIIILTMASYTSAYIGIVHMKPVDGIEPGVTTNISITILYATDNLLYFEFQQNGVTVVHIQYYSNDKRYKRVNTIKGFNCSFPTTAKVDYITCWKYKPTCEDVATYSCKTFKEVSISRIFKANSKLEALEIVKTDKEKVERLTHLTCIASVGIPVKPLSLFVWIVTRHGKTYKTYKEEKVLYTSGCYSKVTSDYTLTSPIDDVFDTNITCKTHFGSLTKRISDWSSVYMIRNYSEPLKQTTP
ncbi:uncharacterized protein LOC128250265 isoform X2 [Octopus bimaculoides]|nr:uncharacterized protein LOC128250265 isoform X2 [Octopus bimaculoides]XP_052830962.1 uncharacterized protein LOC128250265 isoform X2 [Octopus bimaculoides]